MHILNYSPFTNHCQETASRAIAEKIRYLNSEVAIKYMEEDLVKVESQMKELDKAKDQTEIKKPINIEVVMEKVGYFLEHPN